MSTYDTGAYDDFGDEGLYDETIAQEIAETRFPSQPPVNIPHFNMPFRFGAVQALVVEQGSQADIENCIEAILRTQRGSRLYVPNFGIDDPTFSISPVDITAIQAQVQASEPRATPELSQVIENLVAYVKVGSK